MYIYTDRSVVGYYTRAGSDLAGGFYAIVYVIGGDQDYKRDCLNLANVKSNKPCTIYHPTPPIYTRPVI